MPEEQNNIQTKLRSEEVQEILTRIPGWMTRWGISLIFGIIALLFFMAWFIRYPDVIKGTAQITTSEPPVKLVIKSAGEVEHLFYADHANVQKNKTIAIIKSTLSEDARSFLFNELGKIRTAYETNSLGQLKLTETNLVFGDLQLHFSELKTTIKNYQHLVNDQNTHFNIRNISQQIANQKALQQIIAKQLKSASKLMINAESKFKSDRILFEKGVISQAEFFEREKMYEGTTGEISNLEKNKITVAIEITNLEKQLNDLKYDFNQRQNTFILELGAQIKLMESILLSWTRSYQVLAPVSGKLSYLQTVSENQYVEQGTKMFAIIPKNQDFIANLKIPKSGYGKVQKGQKVILNIDNFPSYEYGQLIGKVESVSLIPNEENYLVRVKLPQKLRTTYKKELHYTPEMSGTAEIVTEDLRITDRIFNQFRNIFN